MAKIQGISSVGVKLTSYMILSLSLNKNISDKIEIKSCLRFRLISTKSQLKYTLPLAKNL